MDDSLQKKKYWSDGGQHAFWSSVPACPCCWKTLFLLDFDKHSSLFIHFLNTDDQDQSQFCNYENLCQRDQAKPLKKHLFTVRSPLVRWHCALLFSYYHSQRLLFSPTKNNFSTTLTPTEKPRYTYWIVFCRFYLKQKYRYHNTKKYWFSIFKQRACV